MRLTEKLETMVYALAAGSSGGCPKRLQMILNDVMDAIPDAVKLELLRRELNRRISSMIELHPGWTETQVREAVQAEIENEFLKHQCKH